jgi:hypothetical protein
VTTMLSLSGFLNSKPKPSLCHFLFQQAFRNFAAYVTGESIQLKGRIRSSFVLDAFPCHPQLGFVQERSSSPNILIASSSESDTLLHFFCRLILWRPLGHSKTIR